VTPLALSYVLAAGGLTGLLLAGRKRKIGWLIGLACQPLWIWFAVASGAYGLILNSLGYGAVYAVNWYRWTIEERRGAATDTAPKTA
jgi:nicotinamide riboside transporter PnuC